MAEQYFNKYLFRKSVTNPHDYIVTHELAEKVWYYNDMKYKSVLIDKNVAEMFFAQHNIPVVKSFTYNANQMFFMNGSLILINNSEEFTNYLTGLKEKGYWKTEYMIVKKKDGSYGGRNIFKISFAELKDNKAVSETLFKEVIKSGYLFQDVVIQHPELNRITPCSVNTLRIDTFVNKQGVPDILNTTLRFSCNNTFVDNITSGGMFVGVDRETGVLSNEAYSNFETGTAEVRTSHPLTGLVFKDFKIPFFQQARQLAMNAAILLPRARVVGWDVGITPAGPVLLEGNYFNGLYPFEIGQKGHRNNRVFRELIDELSVYYNEEGNDLEKLKEKHPLFV